MKSRKRNKGDDVNAAFAKMYSGEVEKAKVHQFSLRYPSRVIATRGEPRRKAAAAADEKQKDKVKETMSMLPLPNVLWKGWT